MKYLFLFLLAFTNWVQAQNVKTYIPERAYTHLPMLKIEVERFAPQIKEPWYFAGLIEHESCISLKHSKCWNTTSELRNNREQGVGLFQMTRTWNANGTIRFDNLTALSLKYKTHLAGMTWSNYKYRPDYQIRSGILLWLEGYNRFSSMEENQERMKMATSAFNGGVGHVLQARQKCALLKGCDASIWFENVELQLPKSKKPDKRYGGKSMYDINVRHTRDIFENRMDKYKQFWK